MFISTYLFELDFRGQNYDQMNYLYKYQAILFLLINKNTNRDL